MVFQRGLLYQLASERPASSEAMSVLTSRQSKLLRLDDEKMIIFNSNSSKKPTGWMEKLQQAGFLSEPVLDTAESIKSFRASLKPPTKEVIEHLSRTATKPGGQLLSKMRELCAFLEVAEKQPFAAAEEKGVKSILNDMHALVLELDEGLLTQPGSLPGDNPGSSFIASTEWLKRVQDYVMRLQKQLGVIASATPDEQQDLWHNLAHEMRNSCEVVIAGVKASAAAGTAWDEELGVARAPRRKTRRVASASCLPYSSHWSKKIAV